ncbi:MAG: membrane protein insertase YidC [Woeseiaceae bacterium]
MDNQRLLIWATFGMLLWMTYQAWVTDNAPPPQPTNTTDQIAPPDDAGMPELPGIEDPAAAPALADQAPTLDTTGAGVEAEGAATIRVVTDVLDLTVSTEGGTVQGARLLNYPIEKDTPDELIQLLDPGASDIGLIQSGLNAAGDGIKPDHRAIYAAPADEYSLDGRDEIIVPLRWTDGQGITVEKTLRFARGSYRIDITHRLINDSNSDWRGAEYAQILRRNREAERSMFDVDSYSFDGPIIFDGEKSEKLQRDDLQSDGPYIIQASAGWVGSIEHHFLTVLIPPREAQYNYNVSVSGAVSRASLIQTPSIVVTGGSQHSFETTAFVGPKLQAQLEEIDESLKLTVDYGWLTIISQPLFWLLSKVFSFVGNWGLAIILVTILIKAAFYKLTEASGRSMAKMREIQPRMKALQDRYKDDRQALSQAMMDLYKREKVNPAAGCLPILIQMPFFLAFYWVLLESVEMRQAPFAFWITDLSSRDPYFILPVIMGAAMLGQQRLNPTPGDPVQAKVMQVMPIIFTAFFAFFPSGLVLYWVTNTLLSIAQQWYINKLVHEEATAKKAGKKKQDKSPN